MGLYKLIERAVMVEWSEKTLIKDVTAGRLSKGNLQSASHAVRGRTWPVTKGGEDFQGTKGFERIESFSMHPFIVYESFVNRK